MEKKSEFQILYEKKQAEREAAIQARREWKKKMSDKLTYSPFAALLK